ncbi:MAG: SH3 domain-containing protein [Nitrospinota bacterium]
MKFRFLVSLFILIPLVCGSTPKNSEALCIKNERANLRKGPGTNHEKLWEVFKYMPFKQLGSKGAWKRIQDVDGDIYWVHGPLTTQKYKCAVIKNNKTNLRTGPGTNFPIVPWAPVDKFFSMKVLKIEKNWVHIEDSAGDKAWIYRPLVWIQ